MEGLGHQRHYCSDELQIIAEAYYWSFERGILFSMVDDTEVVRK